MDENLRSIYYDPASAGGLGGLARLVKELRKRGDYTPVEYVQEWLKKQIPYTVHKDIRSKFPRNRIILTRMNETFFTDLVDMQQFSSENNGYRYIITIIDGFSKYAWALPLQNKTGAEVIRAFTKVFKERTPENVSSDAGSEFNNVQFKKFLADRDIHYYVMRDSKTKCPIVERFNRTLKERMFRYFTKQGNHRYIDVLEDLLIGYNSSFHRSIKFKPIEVTKALEAQVFQNLYGTHSLYDLYKDPKHPNLPIGEKVRIQKELLPFRKGYLPKWTEEIFSVKSAHAKPTAPMFSLGDKRDKHITGRFYPQEIQAVSDDQDSFFRIEKIIRTKGSGKNKKHLVRWLGYTPQFDSWVADEEIKTFKDVKH